MGPDVITQADAWKVYEQIMLGSRVRFFTEPAGLESVWKKHSQLNQPAANNWTDAYLLAFAEARRISVVSFDNGLHARGQGRVLLLPP